MRIWVNGTFDVLHIGHLRLLQYANSFGDVRVGIDKDIRVKELKGDDRPINNWFDRIEMMRSIKYVDSVVGFSTDEELRNEIKKWVLNLMILFTQVQIPKKLLTLVVLVILSPRHLF
jgi:cytidyltransferase-like protein